MIEKDEFTNAMTSGISVEEARSLTKKAQRDEALSKAPKINMSLFRVRGAQDLSNLWFSQRTTATVKQKDEVGLAFISRILGLGDEIAQKFARGDNEAYRSVGEKRSAMPIDIDASGFWQKIREIFPDLYTDKAVNFLVEAGMDAVSHFLGQLEVPLAEESPILRSLATNVHARK